MTTSPSWQLAARHLALDAATIDVVRTLGGAGIDSLLLKGPVTASRLYADEPHRRCYGDVDLLVSPGEFDHAEAALGFAGYRGAHPGLRPSEIGPQEATWLTVGPDRLAVDLHRTLPGVRDAAELWRALWAAHESITLQGIPVAVPNRCGSALIVALHASHPGRSRQPYRDLARAAEVFDDAEWSAAVALARHVGAEAGMAAGLAAVPGSRHLLARHSLSESDISTAARMFTPDISPAGQAIRRVLAADGFRARLRYLVSRAYPSEAAMRKNWWVTGKGNWGLAKAHRQRYLGVVFSIPEGVGEVRRASRRDKPTRPSWAAEAIDTVRQRLALGGLDDVDLVAPDATTTARQVRRTLERGRASCLERSLVWQRFYASRGDARTLVIGVSAPDAGFHAHAWLAGDRLGADDLYEILRRPVPESWMGQS